MNKIITTCALILAVVSANAQKPVLFKLKFSPGTTYTSTVKMDMDMTMDIAGDKIKMDSLKAAGMQLPFTIGTSTTMGYIVSVDSKKNSAGYPTKLEYTGAEVKQSFNGQVIEVPTNNIAATKLYGICNEQGKMILDSASAGGVDDKTKAMVMNLIKNMQEQVQFPSKPLKIGESFTQQMPFNLPLNGSNATFLVNIVYKLIAVNNNVATFNVVQNTKFDFSHADGKMPFNGAGSGNGTGIMKYDIKKNFYTDYTTTLNFIYEMRIAEMTMKGNVKMNSKYSTVIN